MTPPAQASGGGKRRPTALELGLLAVGLAGLAFAAGAGGWVLGRESKSGEVRTVTRTVTVAAPPAATGASTTGGPAQGDPAAGRKLFVGAGCGSCHTLRATGATGTVGPNLDQAKLPLGSLTEWISDGKGAMPSFKGQLSAKEIADVAAFIEQVAGR